MKSLFSGIFIITFSLFNLTAQSIQDGLRHLENENYKSAMDVFDKLIAMQPKAYINHYYKAEVYVAMGNSQAAKTSYLKGLEISSKCDECLIGLGRLDLNENKTAEATKHLESALKGNSKNANIQALVGKAYLYADKPQPETALIYLEKARDLDPKQSKYWIYLGDAYQMKEDLGQAMTSYETAVEKDKNDPETYVKMARIWAAGKNLDLAVQNLQNAIKIDSGYALAYKELYEMLIRSRKFDQVIPILDKYVELSGSDVDAKVRLVKFLCFQAKDYNRAIVEANKILENSPEQYTLYRWLAWSYYENGEYNYSLASSYKLFRAVEQGDPSEQKLYPNDYEYAGKAALKLKLADTSDLFFNRVINLQPERKAEIAGMLGKAYYDIKRYDKAESWYLTKDSINPLTSELLYLGMSQKFQKKFVEADTTFGKLLVRTPGYEYGWLQRADIQHKLDTSEPKSYKAKPFYDKFIELASMAPDKNKTGLIEAYIYMLVYNAQIGAYDSAKSYCEMVLNIDPEESRAVEYSKILNGENDQKPKNK
ncbi:MAG: hypothetical protein IPM34_12495 [Saprospiraceae bacterium]|nr:hypothetical protein [Saprospiraceae bacterium]